MASAAITPEEYLAFERKATTKHEYLNGQIRHVRCQFRA